MKKKSTMEVCAELGVSRTTFKGWVYDILGRTQDPYDNTTLEFTEEEIITLWQIRFYKQLKYSNSKIKAILNDPHFDISRSLTFQIKELTKQKEEMEKRLPGVRTLFKGCIVVEKFKEEGLKIFQRQNTAVHGAEVAQ